MRGEVTGRCHYEEFTQHGKQWILKVKKKSH